MSLITNGNGLYFLVTAIVLRGDLIEVTDARVEFCPHVGEANPGRVYFGADVFLEFTEGALTNLTIACLRLLLRLFLRFLFHHRFLGRTVISKFTQLLSNEGVRHEKWGLTGLATTVDFWESTKFTPDGSAMLEIVVVLNERSL